MRLRDHDRADLALAATTLCVAALAAGSEAVRWVSRRRRRRRSAQRPAAPTSG